MQNNEEDWDCIVCGEPLLKGDETNIHEWCQVLI